MSLKGKVFAAMRDRAACATLLDREGEAVRQAFVGWCGEATDDDERRMLVELAAAYRAHTGDEGLVEALSTVGDPLLAWGQKLERASALIEAAEWRAAIEPLTDALIDARTLTEPPHTRYRALSFGLLGRCYFHAGAVDKALEPSRRALELVNELGDGGGIVTYLSNLYELCRYLRDRPQAAWAASQLGDCFQAMGQPEEAARWRAQAGRVAAGEPPVRAVAIIDGQPIELEEVPRLPREMVRFVLVRDRPQLGLAVELMRRAECSRADPDAAIALLAEAASVDPYDPEPHYRSGVIQLLHERPEPARRAFRQVERLTPRWRDAADWAWLAARLEAGALDVSSLYILLTLDDEQKPLAHRLELALQERQRAGELPQLQFRLGRLLEASGDAGAADAAYTRGAALALENELQAAESRCLWSRSNLVVDSPTKRRALIERILALPHADPIASAQASITLRMMTR